MRDLRIIFMGTPDFAVGILDTIYNNNYTVAAVITAPDRPAGRGQKLKYSAVKEYALEKGLPILQPTNLRDEGFLEELRSYEANLQVVVAFRMLPEVVWQMPSLGTFNLHASLLPDYRGAAPINWALINGEKKTGVTTFFIDEKIDTGAMILKKEIAISDSDNMGSLHDKLRDLGAEAVIETLNLISLNQVKTIAQPQEELKPAPKLTKENCKLDFSRSALDLQNHIRGLSPYPSAWCIFKDVDQEWNVKLYEATYSIEAHNHSIGKVFTGKKELKIATKDGFLLIHSLQFPGKKQMNVKDFLNGMTFSEEAVVC